MVTITATGSEYVMAGGIAGISGANSVIKDSYSSGNVTVTGNNGNYVNAGGIAGQLYGATIQQCWASGAIEATKSTTGTNVQYTGAGGIAGRVSGTSSVISNCGAMNVSVTCDAGADYSGRVWGNGTPATATGNRADYGLKVNGTSIATSAAEQGETHKNGDWKNFANMTQDDYVTYLNLAFGTSETSPWKAFSDKSDKLQLWFEQ
jgi:hypothetical protein